MSYGFEIRDSGGTLTYSSLDSTFNFIFSGIAPANQNITFNNISNDFSERVVTQQMIGDAGAKVLDSSNNLVETEALIHSVILSGTTLTATRQNTSGNTAATFIAVFGR